MSARVLAQWLTGIALAAVLFATPAGAQTATATATQTLDRVDAYGATRVIEMQFGDPARSSPYVDDGISGTGFLECKLTSIKGLYCLDGKTLRRWPNPKHAAQSEVVLRCDDPALNLDTRKPNPCTTMTVDQAGSLWLAGRKGNAHSLLKVIPAGATGCATGYWPLQNFPGLCAREYASGRPIILDADVVDGEVAASFAYGTGVLALEDRKKVVFFRDQFGSAPVEIASGKSGWGLTGSETLQGVTLMQLASGSAVASYAVVTTSRGRVLAANVAGGSVFPVHDVTVSRTGTACNATAAQFGLRASRKSGRVYVSDRNYCRVLALQPTAQTSGGQFLLASVMEAGQPLTLSTGTIAVDSPTIAPGISIDLEDCYDTCNLVTTSGGAVATLQQVQLGSVASGMTLFRITGITDCRWAPSRCDPALLSQVIVDPDNRGNPAAQYLNVTPLLPREITDLFIASGGLPKLLVSPQYRGQSANGYVFEAFFGITEPDVIFRDQFLGEFNIAALAGQELGCRLGYPAATPVGTLLQWDIATKVSENFISVDLPGLDDSERHVDMLVNSGCGSMKLLGDRWSMMPYNLELTPDTYGDTGITMNNDAVFGRLLLKLYDDLELARAQLACVNVDADAGSAAPLSSADCSNLAGIWANGKDKLNKCFSASTQPKQSSGDQNCQAFQVQLRSYQNALENIAFIGIDPANRLGELKVRVNVIEHVLRDRFLPSVPAGGFCSESGTCLP